MPNFHAMLRSAGSTEAGTRGGGSPARRDPAGADGLRGEGGFMLVEVLMSAMLVAIIVVSTFTGFEAATRDSADQRRHNVAVVLAAQSQEQLRSDPAATLVALEYASHSFTKTVNGTIFTISQEAKAVAANGESTGCSASETKSESGANIQITSIVTWALQKSANRPAVKASSIITPPVGSALEVDVTNGGAQDISGVTAKATFIPVESATPTSVEGTTGSTGCVILTGIAATSATVEIGEKTGYVTPSSALKWPTKEVKIAPNLTTHYPVTYAEAGRIVAKYTYKGATSWEGKEVRGDTFVVTNSAISEKPGFLVGSTTFEYGASGGEEKYKALTSSFSTSASTATATRFPKGDLFPFETPKWQVYAGDCTANSPESMASKGGETLANPSVRVEPGQPAEVAVPMSYLQLNLYEGAYSAKGTTLETGGKYPVAITNSECASAETPNAALGLVVKHTQTTEGGHLFNPFQPFGKQEFCMVNNTANRVFRESFESLSTAGATISIYPGEASKQEKETKESEEKAARVKKEGEEKKARETTESNEKKARETKEAEERNKWKEEESKHLIKAEERTKKEATQKKEREAAEKTEAEKKKKAEETETAKRKEAEKTEGETKTAREKFEKERPYSDETGTTC